MSDDRYTRDPDAPDEPPPLYRAPTDDEVKEQEAAKRATFRLTPPPPKGRPKADEIEKFLREFEAQFGKPGGSDDGEENKKTG